MFHEHPIKIIKYALKNIWLLIFPLLRGIRSMKLDIDAFYSWAKGTWFDILIIVLIIGFGYLRWLFTWFSFGENDIDLLTGIVVKKQTCIPYNNISAITAEQSFYLRPFKASRLKVDTCAGMFNTSDMSLLIRREDFKKLHKKIPEVHSDSKKTFVFKPKLSTIIFFSFVFSSSLSGAVYLAAIFFQSGRIAADLFENGFKDALNEITSEVSAKLAIKIPPVAIGISIVIIALWLFSFVSNVLRYTGFSMNSNERTLKVKMGYITRRHYHIVPDKVNYIDLRQNLLMKIFRVSSVNVSCSGYGHQRGELPVLLPILSRKQVEKALDIFSFGSFIKERDIKALKSATITYLWIPLVSGIAVPILTIFSRHIFSSFTQIVTFLGIMFEIPIIWLLVIKVAALFTSGASIENGVCCIRFCKGYAFHTVIAEREKLVKVHMWQTIFQKPLKRVNIAFYFNSETVKRNVLYGVNIDDARKFLKKMGISE